MDATVQLTAQFVAAARRAYSRKWSFLLLFAVAFALSVVFMAWIDLLPEAPAVSTTATSTPSTEVTTSPVIVEVPIRVEVPAIGLAATIANPATTNAEALDALLLKGAVRYPTSAELGENGNIVLFGHSSYLPVVLNQSYKTFNDIQKLKKGDTITLYGSDIVYTYAVRSVAKESVDANTPVPLTVAGKVLTLVTCNSFASKSDRFVVTADFVESHALRA